MNDNKLFSILSLIFGLLGFISSFIICIFIIVYKSKDLKVGDYSFIYYFSLVIICFICNTIVRRKVSDKNSISMIGKVFSVISLVPFIIVLMLLFLVLLVTPYILQFEPTIFP